MAADPQSWALLMDVFTDALELSPGPEREAYLTLKLGADNELRAEAVAMLHAHEQSEPLEIEKRLDGLGAEHDLSGTQIGNYRLVRLIARGGMGEVYAAKREDAAFRQQVALKLLRHGMGDMEARVRFRQERQILARLIHPLIVPLLDGGVTADGRPYLVMQYAQGEPLTAYCKSRNSSVAERLRLLCDAARAVEHAHRNLVVHRDLKPSNILVSPEGQVRLLDFGVAKMLDPEMDDPTPVTRTEMRIMTVDYAAPEQIRGEPVTTATDIYSLGALLYELLAGRRPFSTNGVSRTSLERAILDLEPEVPSLVAAQSGNLNVRLDGDLDKIVLKAMAKDPGQRYASAEELTRDIERYLAGEPVIARKPSVSYRFEKFVRRNRLATGATVVSIVLLAGLGATILLQSRRVARERDLARAEQERANRVVALLVDLFASANPENTPGGSDLTIGEFLKKVEGSVVANRDTDPAVQMRLRHTLGKMYLARSQYPQARTHLEAALAQSRLLYGDKNSSTGEALHDLATLTTVTGPADKALDLLQQSLRLHRDLHGEHHETVAQALQGLSNVTAPREERRALLEKALAIRRNLTTVPDKGIANNLNALGVFAHDTDDPRLAAQYFEESLAILNNLVPDGHPSKLSAMSNLAVMYDRLGRLDKAEQLGRTVIEEQRRVLGEESHSGATAWGNLGVLLVRQGKHAEAEDAFRKALPVLEKLLGPAHFEVDSAKRNLGVIRVLRGDPKGGQLLLHEAAESHLESNGPSPGYWFMVSQEAMAKSCMGRGVEAAKQLRNSVAELSKPSVNRPKLLTNSRVFLGYALLQTGRVAEAEDVFRQALEERRKRAPIDADSIAEAECGLGAALAAQHKPEGRELLRRSLPAFKAWGLANPYFVAIAEKAVR